LPIDLIPRTEQISFVESVNQVKQYVEKHQLISRGDRILVAVSGGPDSVALLHLLLDLRDEFRLHLEVAHLQHGIRGEEAKDDARFVSALALKLGVPFHLKEVSLGQIHSTAGKGNLEALAREERYRFFAEVVHARGLRKVATAHTQDDQAETVMMRFLRGSGMTVLGGMARANHRDASRIGSSAGLTVVRPLLGLSKAAILDYLAQQNLTYRVDRTNQDSTYLRNWARLELLPKIQERVDHRLNERLGQQAELLRDDDALLTELAQRKLQEICGPEGLLRPALLAEPIAMQRRLLRRWIETVRGHLRGLDFVHVEELIRLMKEGAPQRRLAIPGGWEMVREYDVVKLVRRSAKIKRQRYSYELHAGSSLPIAEAGWEIRSELIEKPLAQYPADLTEAVFDVACLTEALTVRNFRHGDYFQPLGMTGHRKIKDLFIDNKLTLSLRAKLPLLVLGEEVIWIPGCGRSERAKVTAQTTAILRLKLVSLVT